MKWLSDQERLFMEDDETDHNKPSTTTQINPKTASSQNLHASILPASTSSNYGNVRTADWEKFDEDSNLILPNAKLALDTSAVNSSYTNEMEHNSINNKNYFLDELSRDLGISRELIEGCCCGLSESSAVGQTITYQEEEIDGPELARLIRRMRPRDMLISAGIGSNSQMFYNPTSFTQATSSALRYNNLDNNLDLYSKIHQNLMKGKKETRSVATSEREEVQSSLDLDWDHEPGMNPSLALQLKRTDTEEDLVKNLITRANHLNPYNPVKSDINCPPSLTLTASATTVNETNTPAHQNSTPTALLSPDTEDLAWDMEDELCLTDNQLNTTSSNDKCHLLSS